MSLRLSNLLNNFKDKINSNIQRLRAGLNMGKFELGGFLVTFKEYGSEMCYGVGGYAKINF